MLDVSIHGLGLLLGVAIAGVAAFGAIAVGPYGRRGTRLALSLISFAACLGTAAWFWTYLGLVDQRRSIEARITELRAQALSTGSALACTERTESAVETACEHMLFGAPEILAAVNLYTSARFDLLVAAARYRGPRDPQFDLAVGVLQRSLQADPFGLTAHLLTQQAGCTAQRCEILALFPEPSRVRDNMRQKAFEASVARYAGDWRTPVATTGSARIAAPIAAAEPVRSPAQEPPPDGAGRAAMSEKYTFPSASSIPPVSIMNDEPAERAPPPVAAPKEKPSQPVASAATPEPAPRRETKRQNAPLVITPKQ